MSARYKLIDNEGVYFTKSTIAGWTDACLNGTGSFLEIVVGEDHGAEGFSVVDDIPTTEAKLTSIIKTYMSAKIYPKIRK